MAKKLTLDVARHGSGGVRRWFAAFSKIGFHVIVAHRISAAIRFKPLGKIFSWVFNTYARLISGCYLSEQAKIAGGLFMPHPTGIVIGEDVVIGPNATIFQNVTLGSSDRGASAYPTLGRDVTVFANAVVLGRITIGDGVRIGAGAVVIRDVPAGYTAVGNPARNLAPKS